MPCLNPAYHNLSPSCSSPFCKDSSTPSALPELRNGVFPFLCSYLHSQLISIEPLFTSGYICFWPQPPWRQELCLFHLVINGSVKQEACWWLPFTPSSFPLPGLSGQNCPRQYRGTSKSLCAVSFLLFLCRCLMCLGQIFWPSLLLTAR